MREPYLTVAEINARYPDAWVLLANPTVARDQQVTGGHVVLHARDRAEYYRLVDGWNDPGVRHLASWFTGEIGKEFGEVLPADPEPGAA